MFSLLKRSTRTSSSIELLINANKAASSPWAPVASSCHGLSPQEAQIPARKHVSELKSDVGISTQAFFDAMIACGERGEVGEARKIHSRLVSSGLGSATFLLNNLVRAYSKCGSMEDARSVFVGIPRPNLFSWNTMITACCDGGEVEEARKLFDEMPERVPVSWNSMMSGYVRAGRCREAVLLFAAMISDVDCRPDDFTVSCTFKACGIMLCTELGCQVHCFAAKTNLAGDQHVAVSLLDMYIKCSSMESAAQQFKQMDNPDVFCWNNMMVGYSKSEGVRRALDFFYKMPRRDLISWNSVISILSQHGWGSKTLAMFVEMQDEGFAPDYVTYSSVLSACASITDLLWGRHLHARIIKFHECIDVDVGSALVDMYSKCGSLKVAKLVFDSLKERNVVSWTSLIAGFIQSKYIEEALELFNEMREEDVALDEFSIATVLGGCCNKKDMGLGCQLHCYSIRNGLDHYVPVSNALLAMYAKCGSVQNSENVFNMMMKKDVISWTSMVTAFAQVGDLVKAVSYFHKMPERNVVTWNSMLAAYVQHDQGEEGLKLYILMRNKEKVRPDWVTFATLLSACADLGALKLGKQVVGQAVKSGLDIDTSVANGIIMMYAKCGRITEARDVFDSISKKDLVSWNSMISGYAQNGQGRKALEIFENMLDEGLKPDHISYVGVLSGCSHSGLVAEGRYYFDKMTTCHSIPANTEHFACMVDLLGRSGLLEEAKAIIDGMPIQPNVGVWGALLGACKVHCNPEIAEHAVKHLLHLDATDSGSYILLANIYSDAGKDVDVANVRKLMKERGIKKDPGCSWIEANNRTHVFTVDDISHPQITDVLTVLGEIVAKVELRGYMNKSRSESHHSEKLAFAFGLFTLPPWMPIHIMKNLRVCNDCHSFLKMASLVTARELVVRDGNRFHHFKDGSCSCGDYW